MKTSQSKREEQAVRPSCRSPLDEVSIANLRVSKGLWLTVLACALAATSWAGDHDFSNRSVRCYGRDVEYIAYVPVETKVSLPVLVLLHGAGDRAEHFAEAWKTKARKNQIILIAPQLPRDPTLEPQIPQILPCLIDDARKSSASTSFDLHRVHLFGYSMGGYLAYDAAFIDSDYFAAAAIHAMGIADEYMPIVDRATRKIPISISIGDRDQLVSLDQVRKTRDVLNKKGFPIEYREIASHTHNYYEMADDINDDVWRFLEAKRLP